MHTKIRFLLAIITGIVAGGVVIRAIETITHFVFEAPVAPEPEMFCVYLDHAPAMALVFYVVAWVLGAFVAGMVAKLIYRFNNKAAFIAGAVLLIFLLAQFFILVCHPLWMQILGALLPVPMAMIGSRLFVNR